MRISRFISVIVLLAATAAARAENISVAAAISLKESLQTIKGQFESMTGDHVELTFASSGQLATQIQNGAPIDLFISAARKQVDDLKKAGNVDDSEAVVVAGNELVLIVPAGAKSSLTGFENLADPSVKHLAVGDPKTVPAGEYAQQVLEHLKLTDKVKDRLILGLNVRQVLQYVQGGDVDAGIVYRSDAQQAGDQVQVIATADASWHKPLEYWGVIVTGSKHAVAAQKLLDYLKTEPAQKILRTNGFASPATQPTTPAAK